MKLKTSFFNLTAFKKNLLRFSPIWALYTVFLLVVFFGATEQDAVYIARDAVYMIRGMAPVNLLYGGICAMFLFGDLFNSRLSNALHAFPVRREGWLLTGIAAGVLFCVVPNLLLCLVASAVLQQYTYLAFIWLAVSTLQFLFFFGTAVFSAMCAGNRLGMIAIYGIIQFITVLVFGLMEMIYVPLLYGVKINFNDMTRFFPLGHMMSLEYVTVEYNAARKELYFEGLAGADWRYLALCAAAGVVCMTLGWLVYRRRQLESAGDFISLRPLAPVCLVILSIGAGAGLYAFSEVLDTPSYVFLAIGLIIGYFAGRMLLGRTLRVFGKKSILTLVAVMVVFGGSLLLTRIDPLGITTYIPQTENVEAVYIYGADKGYYYYSDSSLAVSTKLNENDFAFTDPEEIADWQDFHRQLTKYRPSDDDGVMCDVEIFYKLKSGRIVSRYYEVGRDTELGEKAGKCFSDMRYIFEVSDTQILYDVFESVHVDIYWSTGNRNFELTDPQEIAGLLDAMALDCQTGKMAQNWAYHEEVDKDVKEDSSYEEAYVEFYVKSEVYDQGTLDRSRFHIRIYNDSTNTHAYLAIMRQLDEYKHTVPDTPQLDADQNQ